MDPIDGYIRGNKKYSLQAFVSAHSILSLLQASKGGLCLDDVLQSLAMSVSGQELSPADLNAHAALVYEGALAPLPLMQGRLSLQMKHEVVGNEEAFLKSLLLVLYAHCAGAQSPVVEEFKADCVLHLQGFSSFARAPPPVDDGAHHRLYTPYGPSYARKPISDHRFPPNTSQFTSRNGFQQSSRRNPSAGSLSASPFHAAPSGHRSRAEEDPRMLSRIEFEKSEPIVRLLAQVRKVGMDILFPQSTHDKILACIYVAICSVSTPAHRELIDMVMAVKESRIVSQLEGVSKTKVRGVLALLKHGELLITQGSEGEPVRLFLAPGIDSFRELRKKHDVFLNRYMADHHLFIPAVLRSELVWQMDEDMYSQRLDTMNKLVEQLGLFFRGYVRCCESEDAASSIDSRSCETPFAFAPVDGSPAQNSSKTASTATTIPSSEGVDWEVAGRNAALSVLKQQHTQSEQPAPTQKNTSPVFASSFPGHSLAHSQEPLQSFPRSYSPPHTLSHYSIGRDRVSSSRSFRHSNQTVSGGVYPHMQQTRSAQSQWSHMYTGSLAPMQHTGGQVRPPFDLPPQFSQASYRETPLGLSPSLSRNFPVNVENSALGMNALLDSLPSFSE